MSIGNCRLEGSAIVDLEDWLGVGWRFIGVLACGFGFFGMVEGVFGGEAAEEEEAYVAGAVFGL